MLYKQQNFKKVFKRYLTQTGYTWWEEGCEIVEDLRVPLPSCETHHRAHVQRESPQLLPRAQAVHFQHVFHVVEETHKQEAGVCTGRKHCSGRHGKVTIWISVAAQSRSFGRDGHRCCKSLPMTSLSCWGISSFHLLGSGEAKSILMRRYRGASRLVLKVNSVSSLVTYSYSASKLSMSFTHGKSPKHTSVFKVHQRNTRKTNCEFHSSYNSSYKERVLSMTAIYIWNAHIPVIPWGMVLRSQYHSLLTGSQPSLMDSNT